MNMVMQFVVIVDTTFFTYEKLYIVCHKRGKFQVVKNKKSSQKNSVKVTK